MSLPTLLACIGLLLAGSPAQAGPAFRPVGQAEGCTLLLGPDVAPGLPSFRAECTWPEMPAHALRSLLDRAEQHDELFWMIAEVALLAEGPDGTVLLHQRHEVPGVRAREVTVRLARSRPASDHWRWTWTSEPGPVVDPSAVQAARNDGSWELRDDGSGGSRLAFQLAYDPAGAVPRWLVRWCQSAGAVRMLAELRQRAGDLSSAVVRSEG